MMVWTLISTFILALLIPGEGQTVSWQNGTLQGQMFSVMSGGEVRFQTDALSNVTGLTVCMRVLTVKKNYRVQLVFRNSSGLVSYSGPDTTVPTHYLTVNGYTVSFKAHYMTPSFQQLWPWMNRCFTWQSSSGMAQLWFDGKMSVRKGVARGQVFSGEVELSLSAFEGQVTDVYVWDSVLLARDLSRFLSYSCCPSGSVLDWRWNQYSTSGYVVLEPTSVTALSAKLTRRKKKRERKQAYPQ